MIVGELLFEAWWSKSSAAIIAAMSLSISGVGSNKTKPYCSHRDDEFEANKDYKTYLEKDLLSYLESIEELNNIETMSPKEIHLLHMKKVSAYVNMYIKCEESCDT